MKKSFNEWAKDYEEEAEEKIKNRGYSYDILAEKICKYITKERKKILELGTGTGLVGKRVKKLINKDSVLVGIDISDKMLEKAKEKNVYNKLILGTSDELLENENYDVIYSSFMFHSLNEQKKLLNNMYNSLKKDGYFILIDLIPNAKIEDSYEHSLKYEYGAPSNYLNYEKLNEMLKSTKFFIQSFEYLGIKKDYSHYICVLKKG